MDGWTGLAKDYALSEASSLERSLLSGRQLASRCTSLAAGLDKGKSRHCTQLLLNRKIIARPGRLHSEAASLSMGSWGFAPPPEPDSFWKRGHPFRPLEFS